MEQSKKTGHTGIQSGSLAGGDGGRLVSLDVLRGFDMFFIIGGREVILGITALLGPTAVSIVSRQLQHARWEGFVFWDLIMPLFLFMVGTSMSFSFRRKMTNNDMVSVSGHILRRFFILYVLGLFMSGRIHLLDWERIVFFNNTLQAIAVGYLVTSFCILYCKIRVQVLVFIGLLVLYWAILFFVPGPDFSAGAITEEKNIARTIDTMILGRHRQDSSYTWILSCLTFTASVLSGVFAGYWLQAKTSWRIKAGVLLFSGIVLILSGLLWGKYNLPVIKYIWTSSMVLVATGWSLLLLLFFYFIVDVCQVRRPFHLFRVIGLNSIFAYVIWSVFGNRILPRVFTIIFTKIVPDAELLAQCMTSICSFAFFWCILYCLYKKEIFIKI